MLNEKISVNNSKNKSIYEFSNSNVVFILPDDAFWIKTTTTGLWLYEQIKNAPMTTDEIIQKASEKFNLPAKEIEGSISLLLNELYDHGVFCVGDKTGNTDNTVQTKNETLKEVWFNLTSYCNLSCSHCYLPDLHNEKRHMPLELAYKIIDEAAEMKASLFTFSGGEPTLHPNLAEIISYAKTKDNITLKLITNGTIQDKKFFKEVVPKLNLIQVSIDGIDETTNDKIRGAGTYAKIVNFIGETRKNNENIKCGISFTPTEENYELIPDLYKLTNLLKVDYLQITKPKTPAINNGDCSAYYISNEFYQKLLQMYDKLLFNIASIRREIRTLSRYAHAFDVHIASEFDPANSMLKMLKLERCGAGILTVCINQNGDIFPCAALCSKVKSFGNVQEKPLKEILDLMKNYMEEAFSVDKDEKCKICDFKYFCGGGCRANDDLTVRDPLCDTLKARYTQLLNNLMATSTKTENKLYY